MNKKIIIAIAAVVFLAILGGVLAIFMLNRGNEPKEKELVYKEFPLDVQYTNIKSEEDKKEGIREQVLKYSPVIKYVESEETLAALTANKTEILNEFRKYFINRKKEQLAKLERVQEDLTDIVIDTLEIDPEKIQDVLFTEFIIQ